MSIKSYRTAVTEKSTTATNLGKIGERREEEDGKVYILVKAGETLGGTNVLEISAYDSATNEITVIRGASTGATPTAQTCGVAIPLSTLTGEYFWMQVGGVAECAGTATAGVGVIQSGTSGLVADYATAHNFTPFGIALNTDTVGIIYVLMQIG